MSLEKVRLSNVDRGIGIFTAVNSYKSRKINEQILVQQQNSNKHLSDLKRQMNEANSINRTILENQLKAEEHKEIQKYYKALSFNLNETVDLIANLQDQMVLNYVLVNYYDKIKANIIESNDNLEELGDKTYNRQILDKLNVVKIKAEKYLGTFNNNVLNKIDQLIIDFNDEERKINEFNKIEIKPEILNYKKITDKWRVNPLRVFGIIILSIICIFCLLGLILSIKDGGFIPGLIALTIFSIPLYFLVRAEQNWRKDFSVYKAEQDLKRIAAEKIYNQKKQQIESVKLENDKKYEHELNEKKERLLEHPLYDAMIEISENHSGFEKSLSEITALELEFNKKWGV